MGRRGLFAHTTEAGGAPAELQRVRPLLDLLGARVGHCGDVAAGHAVEAPIHLCRRHAPLATSVAIGGGRVRPGRAPVLAAMHYYEGRSGTGRSPSWPLAPDLYAAPSDIRSRELADGGARVVAGHDPLVAERLGHSRRRARRDHAQPVAAWASAPASSAGRVNMDSWLPGTWTGETLIRSAKRSQPNSPGGKATSSEDST